MAWPSRNKADWHLELLRDWEYFLQTTFESASEIRYQLGENPSPERWRDSPAFWSLRLDPDPQVRLSERSSIRDLPKPHFPILPNDLLEVVEAARRNPEYAAERWHRQIADEIDEPVDCPEVDWLLRSIVQYMADRPLTWQVQLHFGYTLRQEVDRLHLTAAHWNYGQAWRVCPAFRSFSLSYPQLACLLADIVSCEALNAPQGNRLLDRILECGLPMLLRWVGLPAHPAFAKLLAKIPPDRVGPSACALLREAARVQETIDHLLNLPGSVPPDLLEICQPGRPRIPFRLLRQMQTEWNANPPRPYCGRMGFAGIENSLWSDWQKAMHILQNLPPNLQSTFCERLSRVASRKSLQQVLVFPGGPNGGPPFGPPPKPGNLWIHPVQSVRELRDAANTFRNCLRTCLWPTVRNVWQGTSYFYRVRVENATSLLQITRLPAGDWSLREHLGVGNRPAPKSCQVKVANWARRHGLVDLVG